MSQFTRNVLYPDNESEFETTNRNMRYFDPDYNCTTSNNVLTTKYYLENYFNALIKSNDSYAKGFSLMHLNIRSIPKHIVRFFPAYCLLYIMICMYISCVCIVYFVRTISQ